ncbi:hypothetical protein OE88DRAFT_1372142 [Heliocybe sulcata]|uniref:Uncharacterized protein n=1 Tax=Heliocybe sulcata TaxID=5364 RepID=A0A5C3N3A8_9AGAM|nr:hypothetical protein OE88DRAFT_1372142 [Heliocybe sulcata]
MFLPAYNNSLPQHAANSSSFLKARSFDETTYNCTDLYNCRTISSIVWSCLATIFACTWSAVHPNVPPPYQSWLITLGRQLVTTCTAIVAPEAVVIWAAKQWLTSRRLACDFAGHKWTQTHGFFAIMGGFMLYSGGEPVRVLDPYKDLNPYRPHPPPSFSSRHARQESVDSTSSLIPDEQVSLQYTDSESQFSSEPTSYVTDVEFPDITEHEIRDRSKGNWISKGISMIQTLWFIGQCIARRAQGLVLTELELFTCAFAVLSAVTYVLWWNKPQSVGCAHPVGRVRDGRRASEDTLCDVQLADKAKVDSIYEEKVYSLRTFKLRLTHAGQEMVMKFMSARRSMALPSSLAMKSWMIGIHDAIWGFNNGTLYNRYKTRPYLSTVWLIIDLVGAPIAPLLNMTQGAKLAPNAQYVDPYYSGNIGDWQDQISLIVFLVASSMIFGAVHLFGWFFIFPSRVDQILWRISALAVTCLPLLELVVYAGTIALSQRVESVNRKASLVLKALGGGLIIFQGIIYLAARITLLVLAFKALRSLPEGAYQDISWSSFIPHI